MHDCRLDAASLHAKPHSAELSCEDKGCGHHRHAEHNSYSVPGGDLQRSQKGVKAPKRHVAQRQQWMLHHGNLQRLDQAVHAAAQLSFVTLHGIHDVVAS